MALPINPTVPTPEEPELPQSSIELEESVEPAIEVELPEEASVSFKTFEDKEFDEENAVKYLPTLTKNYHGGVTSEDLLQRDYSEFEEFEGIVLTATEWLQRFLRENEKSEALAKAREERGEAYKEMYELLSKTLVQYFTKENVISAANSKLVTSLVINEMIGLGPIEPLYQDEKITEIMVNGHDKVRVEIDGKLVSVPGCKFRDNDHLLELCRQMLNASGGRVVDVSHPMEDGRLPDQSRINVVHHALGNHKTYLTIRRFREKAFSLKELVSFGAMSDEMVQEVGQLIHDGCSTIVIGGTGSGKTTLLNALSGCMPNDERIITIEDNIELRLHPDKDVVALEARKSSQGDKNQITIRDLVKNTLRMRPDRIIVGEVRDASAYDMLQAMNTGHDGSMTTIHANDVSGAVDRLINLMSEAGEVDLLRSLALIAGGIDVIVNVQRFEDGSRRVASIAEVPTRVNVDENGNPSLEPIILWEFRQTGVDPVTEKIIGEFVRVNHLSEALIKKHRLDKKHKMTVEEIYELSKME